MILLIHILFGAVIIKLVKPFWLALILALLSHYFLDMFPHWEYGIENINQRNKKSFYDYLKVFSDLAVGFIIVALSPRSNWQLAAGGFIAILPDGLTFINIICQNRVLPFLQRFHQNIHFQKEVRLFFRIFFPFFFFIFSLYFLFL